MITTRVVLMMYVDTFYNRKITNDELENWDIVLCAVLKALQKAYYGLGF